LTRNITAATRIGQDRLLAFSLQVADVRDDCKDNPDVSAEDKAKITQLEIQAYAYALTVNYFYGGVREGLR
jgi:hypothetical protein